MIKTCKYCRFAEDFDNSYDASLMDITLCRRFPPERVQGILSIWPTVEKEADWCGEFLRRPSESVAVAVEVEDLEEDDISEASPDFDVDYYPNG